MGFGEQQIPRAREAPRAAQRPEEWVGQRIGGPTPTTVQVQALATKLRAQGLLPAVSQGQVPRETAKLLRALARSSSAMASLRALRAGANEPPWLRELVNDVRAGDERSSKLLLGLADKLESGNLRPASDISSLTPLAMSVAGVALGLESPDPTLATRPADTAFGSPAESATAHASSETSRAWGSLLRVGAILVVAAAAPTVAQGVFTLMQIRSLAGFAAQVTEARTSARPSVLDAAPRGRIVATPDPTYTTRSYPRRPPSSGAPGARGGY